MATVSLNVERIGLFLVRSRSFTFSVSFNTAECGTFDNRFVKSLWFRSHVAKNSGCNLIS